MYDVVAVRVSRGLLRVLSAAAVVANFFIAIIAYNEQPNAFVANFFSEQQPYCRQ